MTDLPPLAAPIALVFLLAGFVKGVTGLGLPTIGMALLSLAMAPAEAAALIILPSVLTNLWQLLAGPRLAAVARRLWPMMLGVCAGTWAGAGLLAGGGGGTTLALGATLMAYAAYGLSAARLRVPPRAERWLGPLAGLGTGLVTGATGVSTIPSAPYLQALALDKEELVQAMGLSFTVSMLALGAGLAREGAYGAAAAGASLLALIPAAAGMAAGQWLRQRVSAALFRRLFFLSLLALGAHLVWRSVA